MVPVQVLENSPARLVLQSRQKAFRVLGMLLLLLPMVGLTLLVRAAMRAVGGDAFFQSLPPTQLLACLAGIFVVGSALIVFVPYRVTHIFDRDRRAYVKESTSVRRTARVEYPLETFCAVEVQDQDDWGCRVVLVNDAGKRVPIGLPSSQRRDEVDAMADLVESFITRA